MSGQLFDVDRDGHVVVRLHVQPGAARAGVTGVHGDALKVRVSAPAAGGRANAAVVELVAAALGMPRRDVTIVSGQTGRRKRLRLRGIPAARVAAWLDATLPGGQ